jgi:DNA mismatch repair protein MutL
VTIAEGGRALVRVSDDGSGMPRDDAVLAPLAARHVEDPLGRRARRRGELRLPGEALPAICSVSSWSSSPRRATAPGRVPRRGGAVPGATPRADGTTVSVARLFHNTPARQKFLRQRAREWRAVSEVLTSVARMRPTCSSRPRTTAAPPSCARHHVAAARAWAAVHGASYADGLLDVEDVAGAVHVAGLVERPQDVGTASRRVFLAVNGRAVRDAGLVRAAEAAYRSTIPAGVRPSLYLDVVIPAGQVDVNVHPAKAEVRFHDRWLIERAVERAVRRALGTLDAAGDVGGRVWFGGASLGSRADSVPIAAGGDVERALLDGRAVARGRTLRPDRRTRRARAPTRGRGARGRARAAWDAEARAPMPGPAVVRVGVGECVVHAHAARARMMFERERGWCSLTSTPTARARALRALPRRASPRRGAVAAPALPAHAPSHSGAGRASTHREALARLGYEAESFGGASVLVTASPRRTRASTPSGACARRSTRSPATGVRGAHARTSGSAATVACKAA